MKSDIHEWLSGQFGDDEAVINEIYAEYVRTSRAKVVELEEAFAAKDLTLLDRIAHAMKGTALMTGDREAADAAITLRKAAMDGDLETCRASSEALVRLVADLEEPVS